MSWRVEWTQAALLSRLDLPAEWVPSSEADMQWFETQCIDLLRVSGSKSGFWCVYPAAGANPWQAKPYVGPGKQRHLGTFATALDAAKALFWWLVRGEKLPSPKKERNKRGEGRRIRIRRKGMWLIAILP
jgi:hypothetical protein